MMELETDNFRLLKQILKAETQEKRLREHEYSPLFGYDNRHYSSTLCKLVEDCLRVRPELRPNPAELIRRTKAGVERFTQTYRRTGKFEQLLAAERERS